MSSVSINTHTREVKSFVPPPRKPPTPSPHTLKYKNTLFSICDSPLPPSGPVPHRRRSVRRSERAALARGGKRQPYLHAIFHLIILNVDAARLRHTTKHQGALSHLFALICCDMTSCGCRGVEASVHAIRSLLPKHVEHIQDA